MEKWKEIFNKTDVNKLNDNVFNLIGKDWFLITAGGAEEYNTMTASWGTLGILWNKPIAICFIRPTRHTFNFTEESDIYSLSFLKSGNREILKYCGAHSGRDKNKIEETGLIPIEMENGSIGYEQAKLILECRKVYYDDLKPVFFLPEEIEDSFYSDKDYHRMYIGQILNAYLPSD